ncbi:MAG: hypothetical protein IJS82_02825 [Paludibacteraceae bacterium]|nr:hypothetical protein [Paludibacteraceae bacterium]
MRKTYYIPTVEIVQLACNMPIALAESKMTPVGAPPRRSMPEGGDKAF